MKKNQKLAHLTGKLSVELISRKGILDADFAYCCDNCGQTIVNYAIVKDEEGNEFTIGLDCKKTLIDNPKIEEILITKGDIHGPFEAKEYKSRQREIEKFLNLATNPENVIEIDNSNVIIRDNKPHKQFPEITGNIIYMQNTGYLIKIGLGESLQKLHNKQYLIKQ